MLSKKSQIINPNKKQCLKIVNKSPNPQQSDQSRDTISSSSELKNVNRSTSRSESVNIEESSPDTTQIKDIDNYLLFDYKCLSFKYVFMFVFFYYKNDLKLKFNEINSYGRF